MKLYRNILKQLNMVRRFHAERYMLLALISFSATVSGTRLFLSSTGYPQIGGGKLHIAHVLWGGLFLFAALLMVIILANRRIYTLGALLGGAGMGLFIDEVGKFITQDNDYFFPAAAPIIYVFFLIIVLLFIQVRRPPKLNPSANLVRALELMQDMVQRPLTHREQKAIQEQLTTVLKNTQSGMQTDLARTILDMVDDDERPAPNSIHARYHELLDRLDDWLLPQRLRPLLVCGLLVLGLLTLKNPASVWVGDQVQSPLVQILNFRFGNEIQPDLSNSSYLVRTIIELATGGLLLGSAVLLFFRKRQIGVSFGFAGLLLGLTLLNVFLFYFEQFSTTALVIFEFILLLGLAYYRETDIISPQDENN